MAECTTVSWLPFELERPIFELAAVQDRHTAYNLLFVAHRIKDWIEPIFYSIVTLLDEEEDVKRPGPSCLNRFIPAFNAKPKDFFSATVKHLCLTPTTSFEQDQAISILSACDVLETLAYGGENYSWDDILAILHSTHLRRLSIELPRHPPMPNQIDRLTPLLKNLTHLDILSIWPHPSVIDLMPNLTHLALDFDERNERHFPLLQKLSERENIFVVAFIVRSQNALESGIVEGYGPFEEARFIPLLFQSELVASDWKASTLGGKDMWWRAEEALKKRKRELRQFYNLLLFHEKDD